MTGNLQPIGWAKMEALGIKHLFSEPFFGGFGSDYCNPNNSDQSWKDRAELVRIAADKAQKHFPGNTQAPVQSRTANRHRNVPGVWIHFQPLLYCCASLFMPHTCLFGDDSQIGLLDGRGNGIWCIGQSNVRLYGMQKVVCTGLKGCSIPKVLPVLSP